MSLRSVLLFFAVIATLMFYGHKAHAACYESGEKLHDELNVCEKMKDGKATIQQVFACAKATGYVLGIVDALDGKDFERTNPFTASQLKVVITKYLKEHASERNLCADILVRESLTAMFPKK